MISNVLNVLTNRDRIKTLEEENKTLKQKLQQKQEHINKVNCFYKKKLKSLQN